VGGEWAGPPSRGHGVENVTSALPNTSSRRSRSYFAYPLHVHRQFLSTVNFARRSVYNLLTNVFSILHNFAVQSNL
jgi:hypothetical protein